MYNDLKKMGADAAAQQYLNSMRMQAAGQNPFATGQLQSSRTASKELDKPIIVILIMLIKLELDYLRLWTSG